MSGIYIPNVNLPEICDECPHPTCRLWQSVNGGERHEKCPIVPVAPHGRLGDLDKLEQMFSDIDHAQYSCFDGETPFYSAADAAQIIRLAPTIIPADPAEEGEA